MNVSAVLLARTIALFDVADLSPRGELFGPRLVDILKERFQFSKVSTEDVDQKGIVFKTGQYEGQTILDLTLYDDGIKLDLQSSTDDGKRFLIENLTQLANEGVISFRPDMVKRWGFVSNLSFYSEYDLDELVHPALLRLGNKVEGLVRERAGLSLNFRAASVDLNFDRTILNPAISSFSIQRRGSTPFGEKKYFSASPLETRDHISLLASLEKELKRQPT